MELQSCPTLDPKPKQDQADLQKGAAHQEFMARTPLEEVPLPMQNGIRLEWFLPDIMHGQYLGIGKALNGSLLRLGTGAQTQGHTAQVHPCPP